jgi:HD superfamily phosphohydrolase YqeK
MMDITSIKNEFVNRVYDKIRREGIGDLMEWLVGTDFFTAPASTRYHGAYEGGLAEHSITVHDRLIQLCSWYDVEVTAENIAIVALFHDLCKVGTYKTEKRWRKDKNQQWEQYDTYAKHEDFAFGGHGSKSMYLVMHFMQLSPEEAVAINCHMGQWDSSIYSNSSEAYEQHKFAWLLHVADEAATYIDGK